MPSTSTYAHDISPPTVAVQRTSAGPEAWVLRPVPRLRLRSLDRLRLNRLRFRWLRFCRLRFDWLRDIDRLRRSNLDRLRRNLDRLHRLDRRRLHQRAAVPLHAETTARETSRRPRRPRPTRAPRTVRRSCAHTIDGGAVGEAGGARISGAVPTIVLSTCFHGVAVSRAVVSSAPFFAPKRSVAGAVVRIARSSEAMKSFAL